MLLDRRSPQTARKVNKAGASTSTDPKAHHIFPIAVVENEQAIKCGLAGLYELSVNEADISLHNLSDKELLYTWPYQYIRRYGRTSKNFQFEAGRRCNSGAGLFSLITENGLGDEIFTQVTKRFEQIRHRLLPLTPSSSQDNDSSDDEGLSPELPPRKYKQDTLRSLFGQRRQASEVHKQSESVPIKTSIKKPQQSPSKPAPRGGYYEEIVVADQVSEQLKTKSPSFFNSLIEMSRMKIAHRPSTSSNSSEEMGMDEDCYHVLNNDYRQKPPLEQNYSQVSASAAR